MAFIEFIKKSNHEYQHKHKPGKFANIKIGREVRAQEFAGRRSLARHDILNTQRKIVETNQLVARKPTDMTEEQRREERYQRLLKWRKEKEVEKQKSKQNVKKAFVVGIVTHKTALFEPPPPIKSESLPSGPMATRASRKKILDQKQQTISGHPQQVSFAPQNAKFQPPRLKMEFNPKIFEKKTVIQYSKVDFDPILPVPNGGKRVTRSMTKSTTAGTKENERKANKNILPVQKVKLASAKNVKLNSIQEELHHQNTNNKAIACIESNKAVIKVELNGNDKKITNLESNIANAKKKASSRPNSANNKKKTSSRPNSANDKKITSSRPNSAKDKKISPSRPNSANDKEIVIKKEHNEEKKVASRHSKGKPTEACSSSTVRGENSSGDEIGQNGKSIKMFRDELSAEIARMSKTASKWEDRSTDTTIPEPAQDLIRQAVGQTHLLINKKMQQYSQLIDQCERGLLRAGEGCVKLDDLQGFWDMVYIQVVNIRKRFEDLEKLQSKGWETNEEEPLKKEKKKAKRVVKTVQSKIKALIDAARKNAQGKLASESEETVALTRANEAIIPTVDIKIEVVTPIVNRKSTVPKSTPLSNGLLKYSARKSSLYIGSPVAMMKVNMKAKKLMENTLSVSQPEVALITDRLSEVSVNVLDEGNSLIELNTPKVTRRTRRNVRNTSILPKIDLLTGSPIMEVKENVTPALTIESRSRKSLRYADGEKKAEKK